MLRSALTLLAAACLALACLTTAASAQVTLKVGTTAPAGSPNALALTQLENAWKKASGGQVLMKVYIGASMGGEPDMVKKLRTGLLDGAELSTVGLRVLTNEPAALDLPLLMQTYEEFDWVLSKVQPQLDHALRGKGYEPLGWGIQGFARFFSTTPRSSVSAMQMAKLFVDAASADIDGAWKGMGFRPSPQGWNDIISSLTVSTVDTVLLTPTVALGLRIHDKTKHCHDLAFQPVTRALLLTKAAWEKVPADLRPALLAAAAQANKTLSSQLRKSEVDAITKMKSQGLQIVALEDLPNWTSRAAEWRTGLRTAYVAAATFDAVVEQVKAYRSLPH